MDGCALGCEDGCDIGQSETEGFSEGWLLGAAVIDGDSEGVDEAQSVIGVNPLGIELGWVDDCVEYPADGLLDGPEEGWLLGLLDGPEEG